MTDHHQDQQDSLDRVAASIEQLVDRIDHQTLALEAATVAMRRHRWTTRVALAALAVALVAVTVAGVSGWRSLLDDRDRSCERGNEVRAAVVRAAGTAVETAALDLAGDDPDVRAEAARIAVRAADQVARDPDLAPRAC